MIWAIVISVAGRARGVAALDAPLRHEQALSGERLQQFADGRRGQACFGGEIADVVRLRSRLPGDARQQNDAVSVSFVIRIMP